MTTISGTLKVTTPTDRETTAPTRSWRRPGQSSMHGSTPRGRQASGELWETYLTGPGDVTDPAQYRTELTRPLLTGG